MTTLLAVWDLNPAYARSTRGPVRPIKSGPKGRGRAGPGLHRTGETTTIEADSTGRPAVPWIGQRIGAGVTTQTTMGTWDPQRYADSARFVSELGMEVVALLAPRPGEAILDLGCGDGVLSERLRALGASVIGVDASPAMVAAARARGLDARVMAGEALEFTATFDAVFSNAALHWMTRSPAVIEGVWRSLKPGGRFVAEMGGGENVAAVRRALWRELERRGVEAATVDPWYFPGAEDYAVELEARGFVIASIGLRPRPTRLPGDILDWLRTFAGSFLEALPEAQREAYLCDVRERLRPALGDGRGGWVVDYVRLRFAARKPSNAA